MWATEISSNRWNKTIRLGKLVAVLVAVVVSSVPTAYSDPWRPFAYRDDSHITGYPGDPSSQGAPVGPYNIEFLLNLPLSPVPALEPIKEQDIIAILGTQKLDDPVGWARAEAIADRVPPEDADNEALAEFYLERGTAAKKIGRASQGIRDLTRAKNLTADTSAKLRLRILEPLSVLELSAGNGGKGLRYLQQALGLVDVYWQSTDMKIHLRARLGHAFASRGDLTAAEKELSKAQNLFHAASLRFSKTQQPPDYLESLTSTHASQIGYSDKLIASIGYLRAELLRLKGQPKDAESTYRTAIKHFAAEQDSEGVAKARSDLALVLVTQGRYKAAEIQARRALTTSLRSLGRDHPVTADGVVTLAVAIDAQGRMKDAETLIRVAIEICAKTGVAPASTLLTKAKIALAANLVHQHRWHAALEVFADVRALGPKTARAIGRHPDYALGLISAGQFSEGLSVARRALEQATTWFGSDHAETARHRALVAMALSGLGHHREAFHEYLNSNRVILSQLTQLGTLDQRQLMNWRLKAVLESFLSRPPDEAPSNLAMQKETADQRFRLASALRGAGIHRALNAARVRAAVKDSQLAGLIRRKQEVTRRLQFSRELLTQLLGVPLRPSQPRALIDRYSNGPNDFNIVSGGSDWSNVQTWNRRQYVARDYSDYVRLITDFRSGAKRHVRRTEILEAKGDVRGQIDLLLAEVSRLEREIRHRFPDYPALVAPKFPTIAEVQSRLKPDQALIATYSTDTATHVWAVPKQGKAAFATVPVGRAQIATLVKHLRKGLEYRDDTLAGIPVFDVDLAHEFYQMLLAPVASGWKPARELLLVAHGALRELPFSLLVTKKASVRDGQRSLFAGYKDVVWLVRSHGVTSLPTITSIIAPPPARRLNSKRRNFVGFADPWFNAAQAKETRPRIQMASAIPPQKEPGILLRAMPRLLGDRTKTRLRDLPRLPQTAYEVAAIARWLQADPARDIFTGARANEQQVKTMDLTPYRVVAFATHAVVPKELDGLTQPALALTAPQIAGVGGDGLLTMDEILNLKLNADWVVLSGCNTGRGAGIGADALSGLARAFLQAGARSLLMTQWEVESTVARLLVGDLFRRQAENRGLSRSEAMRQAKLALIDGAGYPDTDGETLFSYAHPLFWAPFVLYGDSSQALMPTKN